MHESKFSEYWAQAQFCYFRAEAAKSPAAKHLWIQLAQDWIALAENLTPSRFSKTITAQGNNWTHSWPLELLGHW